MKHCLNKRDHYENAPTDEQEIIPQKLQEECGFTQRELPFTADARRRSYVKDGRNLFMRSDGTPQGTRSTDIDWSYLEDPKTNPDL